MAATGCALVTLGWDRSEEFVAKVGVCLGDAIGAAGAGICHHAKRGALVTWPTPAELKTVTIAG
ncbi:hypothetical protein Q8O96_31095, partial [Pseudomonas sp. LPH60]|uniref:hypothetical protein n=1 Tax=Pseudomonas sp. LPH60 TaxID=3065906 RepID=UPI00273BA562